jgi:hypothetical protein
MKFFQRHLNIIYFAEIKVPNSNITVKGVFGDKNYLELKIPKQRTTQPPEPESVQLLDLTPTQILREPTKPPKEDVGEPSPPSRPLIPPRHSEYNFDNHYQNVNQYPQFLETGNLCFIPFSKKSRQIGSLQKFSFIVDSELVEVKPGLFVKITNLNSGISKTDLVMMQVLDTIATKISSIEQFLKKLTDSIGRSGNCLDNIFNQIIPNSGQFAPSRPSTEDLQMFGEIESFFQQGGLDFLIKLDLPDFMIELIINFLKKFIHPIEATEGETLNTCPLNFGQQCHRQQFHGQQFHGQKFQVQQFHGQQFQPQQFPPFLYPHPVVPPPMPLPMPYQPMPYSTYNRPYISK